MNIAEISNDISMDDQDDVHHSDISFDNDDQEDVDNDDEDNDGEDDVDEEETNQNEDLFRKEMSSIAANKLQRSKSKPGIVYLSRIPMFMRPNRLKMIFSDYGQVGRVFLQAEEKFKKDQRKKKTGSRAKIFTEGWIEFKDKKIAKKIALTFNNTPIGGKKTSRHYDDLWNIKYLSRFQWSHLVERLEYEKAVRDQRMRTEISQVKKETNFFIKNIEKKKVLDKLEEKKRKKGKEWTSKTRNFKQRKTDDQHKLVKKLNENRKKGVSADLLQKIFLR
ncbi:pre-rRNA-processing protein esf2-like [Anneissia japonica]|uniref:pre-rRNA-processing protein esf2-like n=1 Tax=Anneissia japonica TaxID=1529436 RepID=UPI0014254CB3|nr:pre-rRNA-processing protein esf2-like [Anneissia japonica]